MRGLYEIQRENELKAIRALLADYDDAVVVARIHGTDSYNWIDIKREVLDQIREVFKLND